MGSTACHFFFFSFFNTQMYWYCTFCKTCLFVDEILGCGRDTAHMSLDISIICRLSICYARAGYCNLPKKPYIAEIYGQLGCIVRRHDVKYLHKDASRKWNIQVLCMLEAMCVYIDYTEHCWQPQLEVNSKCSSFAVNNNSFRLLY